MVDYRQMSPAQQEQAAQSLVLFLKSADDHQQYEPLIIVEFTARLNWDVEMSLTKSPDNSSSSSSSTPTALKLAPNRFESLRIEDTPDDKN